jgi:hypothetical protein
MQFGLTAPSVTCPPRSSSSALVTGHRARSSPPDWRRVGEQVDSTSALSTEDIVKTKSPIARIVIPFSSAKWLAGYLNENALKIEERRKAGQ